MENGRPTARLRDRLDARILRGVPGVLINSYPEDWLPNTLNVSFCRGDGRSLANNSQLMEAAVSMGFACQAEGREPSSGFVAMGRDHNQALKCIQFAPGPENTSAAVNRVVEILAHPAAELRGHESK